MILVTGATGHLGSAAIDKLLKEGVSASQIVALVRDSNKAENLKSKNINIRLGEYDNYVSLQAATKDIDKILFISSSDMYNDRLVQHKNLIDAAVENNVKYIVYTGIDIHDYETTVIPHVTQIHKDTIGYLNTKNVPHTILSNTLYADVIPMLIGDDVLETGIYYPAGVGRSPFLSRVEMAAVAAKVITTDGHAGKEYYISSDMSYSFEDVAAMISEVTGKKVHYHQPGRVDYIATLQKNGVEAEMAAFLAGFGTAISLGELDTNRSDFERIMGRKPESLQSFIKHTYSK